TMEEGKLPQGNDRTQGVFDRNKGNTSRRSSLTNIRRNYVAAINSDLTKLQQQLDEKLYGNKSFSSNLKDNKDRVVFINRDHDGIRVTLLARKFFKPNQVQLDEAAKSTLDVVAQSLHGIGRVIRVEGHTDNLPYNVNGITNWELSSMRA